MFRFPYSSFHSPLFGMTNYPPNSSFTPFAITIVCLCLPTYFIIGCLNTSKGMNLAYEKLGSLATHVHVAYTTTRAGGKALMDKFALRKTRSSPDVALG
jgi:hypothetical protein